MNILRLAAVSLIATCVWAAEFQNGQAARAVIGQSSFSSRESSITPTVLAMSNGWLYAADASRRLLTFDLSQIPGPKDRPSEVAGTACSLCGFSIGAIASRAVLPGVAGFSIYGKTIVAADAQNHRVLIWHDSSLPRAAKGPDVSLGKAAIDSSAVSATSIVDPVSVAFDGKRLFVGDAALHRILVWNSLPTSDTQPPDVVLGQQSFGSVNVADVPGPETISRPTSLASDGVNLFVADALDHRILVFTAADLPLASSAVLNSASLTPSASAPGTLVTIAGVNAVPDADASTEGGSPAATTLSGVEVFLNGIRLPLFSTGRSEIRAQIPYELQTPTAASLYVRIEREDGSVAITNAVAVKLANTSPGVFGLGAAEPRAGMVLHTNEGTPVTLESPAHPGEVLTVWMAGLGAVDDSDASERVVAGQPFSGPDAATVLHPVSALVSGRAAQVFSAELPEGAVGIYQVRVTLPADLPDNPRTTLLISQDGTLSNTVTIPVRNSVH